MMRSAYVAPLVLLAATIAVGWPGCDGGDTASVASATGAGGGEPDPSSSASGKPGSTCYGVLPLNGCTACLEDRCCSVLAACKDTGNCVECMVGTVECEDDDAKAARQALSDCHDELCLLKCPDPLPQVDCDAAEESPSAGACVILGEEAKCNPVTNEGCDAQTGASCDFDSSGFSCFAPPNGAAICAACGTGDTGFCEAGHACYPVTYTCARYCCDDSDCGGAAYCDKTTFVYSDKHPVGLCLDVSPMSGAGGAGAGGGGAGGGGAGAGGAGGS